MSDTQGFPSEEVAEAAIGPYGIACTLAGFMLDTFFFGVFTAQLLSYINSKIKDVLWVKCLVAAVAAMASLSTGYNWWMVSRYFVYNFGKHTIFLHTGPIAWLALIDCINMSLCQAFFAYRAYRLCERKIWIPITVGLCILTCIACTVAIRIIYSPLDSVFETHVIVPPSIIWEASTMLADLIITVSILWGLIRMRTGISHTDTLIARLIRMTLESQVFSATIALILLVDTIVDPANLLGISILLFHSKIYVVGLFYSLNSRTKATGAENITMNNTHPLAFSRTQAATINIEQETEMHVMRVEPPPPPGLNRQTHSHNADDDTSDIYDGELKSASSRTAYSSSPDRKPKVAYV